MSMTLRDAADRRPPRASSGLQGHDVVGQTLDGGVEAGGGQWRSWHERRRLRHATSPLLRESMSRLSDGTIGVADEVVSGGRTREDRGEPLGRVLGRPGEILEVGTMFLGAEVA
jgi:hypothetical protein